MKNRAPILAAAFLIPSLAMAGSTSPSPIEDCAAKSAQSEMNDCLRREWKRADDELNRTYSALVTKLRIDPKALEFLRASESAWIKYRDADCDFATYAASHGTFHGTAVSWCLISITKDRTKELDSQLHCNEGDLSCITPLPPTPAR